MKEDDDNEVILKVQQSVLAPYMLMIVLSAHSFISGIALGFQNDFDAALAITIAIVSHKWVESFAIGVSLFRMKFTVKKLMVLLCVYAIWEPLGTFVGLLVSVLTNGDLSRHIEGFADAVASGTFIYVATIDILVEEFARLKDRYLKAVVCSFAFILMCSLLFLLDRDHNRDDSET